jgi:hypothetical protein
MEGDHSRMSRGGKRLDKFFYTGSIDAVAVAEAENHTGKVSRLRIDLKTNIRVWGKRNLWRCVPIG